MPRPGHPTLATASFSEQHGLRYLHLGSPWVQGAVRINRPHKLELSYIQRMMAWLLWSPQKLSELNQMRALQMGLGAATLTRFCHAMGMATTALEINPSVIALCRSHFFLPANDATLDVRLCDALTHVQSGQWQRQIDVLHIDMYDQNAAAPVLDSEDQYAACRDALTDQGIAAINLFGRRSSFDLSLARIVRVFGRSSVVYLRPTAEGNTIVLAHRQSAPRFPDSARALWVEEHFGLPAQKWLPNLRLCTWANANTSCNAGLACPY